MTVEPKISVSETDDGKWRVLVHDADGTLLDDHILDAEPTIESVRVLIAAAQEHHDALERLVHR